MIPEKPRGVILTPEEEPYAALIADLYAGHQPVVPDFASRWTSPSGLTTRTHGASTVVRLTEVKPTVRSWGFVGAALAVGLLVGTTLGLAVAPLAAGFRSRANTLDARSVARSVHYRLDQAETMLALLDDQRAQATTKTALLALADCVDCHQPALGRQWATLSLRP